MYKDKCEDVFIYTFFYNMIATRLILIIYDF